MARQTPAVRFKFLTGDVNWQTYGGSFISPKFNHGDWDYWLVMEVLNWDEATSDTSQGKYSVSVFAVSPEAAGESKLREAVKSMGFERDEVATWLATDEAKVEVLHGYGIKAQLWSENGNNLAKLMLKAKRDLYTINGMLFGIFMDSPQNGIGSTGWDLIAGNTMAGLERYREAKARGEEVTHSPVMKIMDKISAK